MSEIFKILLIEDDGNVASTVKDAIEENCKNVKVNIEPDISNAVQSIAGMEPDAVILDLIEGPLSGGDMAGNLGWDDIWNHRFVPLIVYTASTNDTVPPLPEKHPFVVRIAKGKTNSLDDVVSQLNNYLPYMLAVKKLTSSITSVEHRVLRDTAPLLWVAAKPDVTREILFERILTRRIAASFDAASAISDQKLSHWEQFIFPPLETDLLMGDFLRIIGQPVDAPEAHRVVLTPSCDLVRRNGKAKAGKILIAKCVDLKQMWERCSIKKPDSETNKARATDNLTTLISESIPRSGIMPLPDFPSILPHMAIDFRSLELIEYEQIKRFEQADSEPPIFERIVSVDSPFKEAIAWAYMHVACRPGLPDRDIEPWVESLITSFRQLSDTKN